MPVVPVTLYVAESAPSFKYAYARVILLAIDGDTCDLLDGTMVF
jgi:hypothetical protein